MTVINKIQLYTTSQKYINVTVTESQCFTAANFPNLPADISNMATLFIPYKQLCLLHKTK